MSMRFSRRRMLVGSALALGAAAGLGLPRGAREAFAQGSTRIRVGGYVESQEQLRQTLEVLKAFEAKQPGLTINPEFTDFSSFADKLATEAAGGNAPDMFSTNVDLTGEYARRGVIRPLDEFIPSKIDLTGYVKGAISANTVKGKLYAIPNDCVAPMIAYNPEAFEKAGIAMPDQMWTWEALAETAVALAKANGPRFWGVEDAGGSYIPCDLFLRAMGKEFYTAERQLGFTKADLAEWYAYWQKLRESGGVPPGEVQALASGEDLTRTGLISGRAAMLFQLTDTYVGLQSLTKTELGIHMLPNGFKGGSLKQHHFTYAGNSSAIWTKSPHAPLLIELIRFMQIDPEGSAIYYRDSGMVPASAAARAALAREGSDSDRRVLAYIDMIQKDESRPRNPGIIGVSRILRRMNEAVSFGRVTPQEAAEQMVAEAQRRIK